jgi:hypothetical protein
MLVLAVTGCVFLLKGPKQLFGIRYRYPLAKIRHTTACQRKHGIIRLSISIYFLRDPYEVIYYQYRSHFHG